MDPITAQGMRMPKLGLGTFRMQGPECADAVARGLALGYRHIDTAERYENEEDVGAGLARGGVPREQVHVTSKVWWDHLETADIQAAAERSLRKLRTDYLDLYLVHWPAPGMALDRIMADMIRLRDQGKVRAVGVANFTVELLRRAVAGGAPIACNQVEYHVLLGQATLRAAMAELGIPLVAYAPLAQGRLADNEPLASIATKHAATPTQVALAWLLEQQDVAAIPKAARPETQRSNFQAQTLHLDEEDRAVIAALPKHQRFVNPAFAPRWDDDGRDGGQDGR